MDNVIFNGEQINYFVEDMFKTLNEVIDEIHVLRTIKRDLNWNSSNYQLFMDNYNRIINKHYAFAKSIYEYIAYFNNLLSGYNELNETLLKKFYDLENDWVISDE